MELIYFATFVVAFISSILSGIAGGGGGFIMAPYWLLSGMTPAQDAAVQEHSWHFVHIDRKNKIIGMILLGILLLASSFITSSAFSIFIAIVLSQVFKLSTLQKYCAS